MGQLSSTLWGWGLATLLAGRSVCSGAAGLCPEAVCLPAPTCTHKVLPAYAEAQV